MNEGGEEERVASLMTPRTPRKEPTRTHVVKAGGKAVLVLLGVGVGCCACLVSPPPPTVDGPNVANRTSTMAASFCIPVQTTYHTTQNPPHHHYPQGANAAASKKTLPPPPPPPPPPHRPCLPPAHHPSRHHHGRRVAGTHVPGGKSGSNEPRAHPERAPRPGNGPDVGQGEASGLPAKNSDWVDCEYPL